MAKVAHYQDGEDMKLAPVRYDVYFMDMESHEDAIVLGKIMREKDAGSNFVYLSTDVSKAYSAFKIHADYFVEKPIDSTEIASILHEIKDKIKEDNIVIKLPSGERRIRSNNLNYINIVKRCLCYHLKDGTIFDGQTLRSSFEKAIYPLN
jgi:DNA-binding LytR/AlgR family response regulator